MSGEFELDAKGNIRLSPLIGYSTGIVAETACMLRLEHVNSPDELREMQVTALQLVLTPAQCQELSKALMRVAEKIVQLPRTGAVQ